MPWRHWWRQARFGSSDFRKPVLRPSGWAHTVHPASVLQSESSLWCRDIEDDILSTLRELDIVTAMEHA